jgi:hypothetical protein
VVASHGTGVSQGPANRRQELTSAWAVAALATIALSAACERAEPYEVDALGVSGSSDAGVRSVGMDDTAPLFPQTGINATTVTVTGIKPATGPFGGGNRAVVRGSGFTQDALVFVGGRLVQPADTLLQDRNSLSIVVPAGRSGSADVRVVVGDQEATSDGAYTYNPLLIEPSTGSIAGGTSVLVTTESPQFDDEPRVDFAGAACTDVRVITPSQVRCKTPAGQTGIVEVSVQGSTAVDEPPLVAQDGFEYLDLTDTDRGGLSGGAITGTVNITVIDSMGGLAVPGAFVLLGDELDTPYQGLTDDRGQLTFSGDELSGPVTVHVAVECMERASLVAFDATNVTVHLTPLLDPSCAEAGAPPPPGRGTAGSFISGQLIFGGSQEFATHAWDALPPPRDNEVRVAYVFTTRAHVQSPNPTPSLNGTMARILEEGSARGDEGYLYRIFARPAALGVYAISGLERRDTGDFTPYVMGIARSVLTAPGEETENIDIRMDIPLDRELQVDLSHLPSGSSRAPDHFRVRAYLDLGAEGVMLRQINGQALDVLTSFDAGNLFRFFAQPALTGNLSDGRYGLVAGWYSPNNEDDAPYSEVRRIGLTQTDEPVALQDLLAIPDVEAPLFGALLPEDRVLRWNLEGPAPDMFVIKIIGGDDLPAWTQIVPGSQSESTIPDLSTIEGLTDITPGVITWEVRAVRIEDFEYNEFKYNLLSPRFWTHTSLQAFMMRR